MEKTHQEIIKEIVTDLLKKMDFEASIEVVEEKDAVEETLLCSVQVSRDQSMLIGQYGVNLAAIQHLVRVMLRKQTQDRVNVLVDINGYFSDKRALLEKEAQKAAEEVLKDNISVALRPMLPYERKIVHSFLSTNAKVSTESVGSGDARKIMVRPRFAEESSPESV